MPSEKAKKQITKMPETTQKAQEQKRRQEVYKQLVPKGNQSLRISEISCCVCDRRAICLIGQVVLGIFSGRGMDINAASAPTCGHDFGHAPLHSGFMMSSQSSPGPELQCLSQVR